MSNTRPAGLLQPIKHIIIVKKVILELLFKFKFFYNHKLQYKTKHEQYKNLTGQFRKDQFINMEKYLEKQQATFKKSSNFIKYDSKG